MRNIAFPSDGSSAIMYKALNVLRDMAEKGNSHIRAQYELLLNLQKKFGAPTSRSADDQNTSPTLESCSTPIFNLDSLEFEDLIADPFLPFVFMTSTGERHDTSLAVDPTLWQEIMES